MIQQVKNALSRVRNYRVVPLKDGHTDDAAMLGTILRDEPTSVADPGRKDFFWVLGDHTRFYVNIYDRTRTVYLVSVAHPAL